MRLSLLASILFLVGNCLAAPPTPTVAAPWLNTRPGVKYVGSKACAGCHRAIYQSYRKTEMGRSLDVAANDPALNALTSPVTVYARTLDRYFEVSRVGNDFFQSEYELDAQGHHVFRTKHKLEYAIGSGINGVGYLIRTDRYLFEAPLTWYSRTKQWDLSPGYRGTDFGFSRLVETGCVLCHSGTPQAAANRPGLFADPPFHELSIGCENCHGPGELHVEERGSGRVAARQHDATIVNPARLAPRIAEQICLNCHQDAHIRLLQPGKEYTDFRPGMYSASVYALLDIPPRSDESPESDAHEYGFEMRMSKCFRASGGALSCLSCHNPHEEAFGPAALARFRQQCMKCHTEQNCTAPHAERAATTPPDDCIGCHMPSRPWIAPHATLTEHRIVRRAGEPYPQEAWQQTTADLPDLVWVNRPQGPGSPPLSSDTLIQAYGLLAAQKFARYRPPLLDLLRTRMIVSAEPPTEPLLETAARDAALDQDTQSQQRAIGLMRQAIAKGVRDSSPYLDLAFWLERQHSAEQAIAVLEEARGQFPFDRTVSRALIDAYRIQTEATGRRTEAYDSAVRRHLQLFPEDTDHLKPR